MRKKIAIFINSIAAGGAERVVSILINDLKNDFDIYLVTLNNIIEYELPAKQKIFCLNQPEKENGFIKIIKLPWLALRYKKFCNNNDIETSFSFLKRPNYINCISKLYGLNSKVILSERSFLSGYLRSSGKGGRIAGGFLTKILYPKADLIIPNSSLIKIDLQQKFNIHTKYQVIYNPIDLQVVQKKTAEKVNSSLFETFTFISVGRFRKEKNYELLIDAFNNLKNLNCKLLFVGKGEEEKKIKTKVIQLQLTSKIDFLGFDINPYKYLLRASCFILSSDYEGFPNVILEALACNLPVIATDCMSGPREILAPNTNIKFNLTNEIEIAEYGILTPVKNVDLLAKAMRLMYSNVTLAGNYKSKALKRAKDFDLPQLLGQFKEILHSDK